MKLSEDLKNCRIVLRNLKTRKNLLDTTVMEYDAKRNEIEVKTERVVLPETMEVKVLFFLPVGMYEMQGTIHEKLGKKTRITLRELVDKDERRAVRYQVNIPCIVDMVTRPGEGKILTNFEATLLNMSATGILMQVPKEQLRERDVVRIAALANGQKIVITAEAMRLQEATAKKEKFGCSILWVNLG